MSFLAGFVSGTKDGADWREKRKRTRESDEMYKADRERRHGREDEKDDMYKEDRARGIERQDDTDQMYKEDRGRLHGRQDYAQDRLKVEHGRQDGVYQDEQDRRDIYREEYTRAEDSFTEEQTEESRAREGRGVKRAPDGGSDTVIGSGGDDDVEGGPLGDLLMRATDGGSPSMNAEEARGVRRGPSTRPNNAPRGYDPTQGMMDRIDDYTDATGAPRDGPRSRPRNGPNTPESTGLRKPPPASGPTSRPNNAPVPQDPVPGMLNSIDQYVGPDGYGPQARPSPVSQDPRLPMRPEPEPMRTNGPATPGQAIKEEWFKTDLAGSDRSARPPEMSDGPTQRPRNGRGVKAATSDLTDDQHQEVLDATVAAVSESPDAVESVEAADAALQAAGKGRGTKPFSRQQRDRAQGTFMNHYREVAAPRIQRRLLEKGLIKEADQFIDFIETSEAKEALGHWADAVFSASVGDMDGYFDSITHAYNTKGYMDDGYSIDRQKSGMMKDEDGQAAGVKVVFKDADGNETSQVMDMKDMVGMGVSMMSPEKVFEWNMQQVQAAQDLAKSSAGERRKISDYVLKKEIDAQFKDVEGGGAKADKRDDILSIAKEILKNDLSGDLPMEEAIAQATEMYDQADVASDGAARADRGGEPVPVLRR